VNRRICIRLDRLKRSKYDVLVFFRIGASSYHGFLDARDVAGAVAMRRVGQVGIADKVTPEYVVVAGADRAKTIGFPRDCVFRFGDSLLERLLKAYEKGSSDSLSELWASAKPL